jgi:predicted branched-subunit amino acid permease
MADLIGWCSLSMEKPVNDPAVRRAVSRTSLSVSLTVGSYGIAFGAAAVASGLTVWQAVALSILTFTGASQFALVGVLGAGGSIASATIAAVLLGSRNTLYGLRLAPVLGVTGWRRAAAAQIVIDESTAVSIAQEEHGQPSMQRGFWLTGIGVFLLWNLFTILGAVGVAAMGDPAEWGLDAAVPAAFLGLVWPRLKGRDPWAVAVAAAVIALLLVPVAPAGVPIIASVAAALAMGWRR